MKSSGGWKSRVVQFGTLTSHFANTMLAVVLYLIALSTAICE